MTPAERVLLQNKSWVQEKLALDPGYFQRFAPGQHPQFLWIGCSDSRIPINEITVTSAGELFIHRNIANIIGVDDLNGLSVLQYAIGVLAVQHVIVCGHYGCAGVLAAMRGPATGPLDAWLDNIRAIQAAHREELDAIAEEGQRWDRMVELNVLAQVRQLTQAPPVQAAWASGAGLQLHGWVYRLDDGVLQELVVVSPPALSR